MENDR